MHVDMRNDSSRLLQGIGQIVAGKSRFAHLTPAREAAVERSIYTGVVKRAGYDGVVLVGLAS